MTKEDAIKICLKELKSINSAKVLSKGVSEALKIALKEE